VKSSPELIKCKPESLVSHDSTTTHALECQADCLQHRQYFGISLVHHVLKLFLHLCFEIILAFDLSQKQSFDETGKILDLSLANFSSEPSHSLSMILISNKADKEDFEVSDRDINARVEILNVSWNTFLFSILNAVWSSTQHRREVKVVLRDSSHQMMNSSTIYK
jgi:hypothetical protein